MERIVIAAYKPHPGKEDQLKSLTQTHWDRLNKIGLVSDRKPIIMEAVDGIVVEVFGWKSISAIEVAHSHPDVQEMWNEYSAVCEYVPIAEVPEAANLFSEFSPL